LFPLQKTYATSVTSENEWKDADEEEKNVDPPPLVSVKEGRDLRQKHTWGRFLEEPRTKNQPCVLREKERKMSEGTEEALDGGTGDTTSYDRSNEGDELDRG